jgi:serine/threonine protein kinase
LSKVRLPWLDALVFLSADDVRCDLAGNARNRVLLKDRPSEHKGILAALLNREGPGIDPALRGNIDITVAKALSRAMESAGIRPSQKSRRIGDYILGDLIFDGPGYQDRLGKHASPHLKDVSVRIRQYSVAQAASEEERQHLKRAAAREFQIIQSLEHSNILPVLDYKEHENGPALLFRYSDPDAVRLDHYLLARGKDLDSGQRLTLLRQLADAMRHAHSKRVIHRALSPQSILVCGAETLSPRLQIYNWQVGVRKTTSTSAQLTQVDDLVEAQSLVYMSPEAISDPRKVTEASDVFSLGAIAFHLFANRPPAADATELAGILRERKGLSISSVVDGAGKRLEELIQWSTHPDVLTRIGSVDDFLTLLDDVEDELTAPTESVVQDPLQARQGDRLPHGYVVKRQLGQGATAKALLVQKDDKEFVLKIALTESDNGKLHEEARALKLLHSEFIVALEGEPLQMNGRTVLVLQKAGDRTLATFLAKDGVPSIDLLHRYGDDLLSAVVSLERQGVSHRDIKPDNIGVRALPKQRSQLVLFDFSLSHAPLESINVGTEGYRDPFLKLRKNWDLAADRYSAAVTLYEMTVGHGALPQWGNGKSDPALTDDALSLDSEKFDPSVRDALVRFFTRALDRDAAKRFDSAYDMQDAWRQAFRESEQRRITTSTGEEVEIGISLDQATLETLVSDLLAYPIADIHLMRGVGHQTRREVIAFVGQLRAKFPDFEASARKDVSTVETPSGPSSLEALHHRIVGVRHIKKDAAWDIRAALLRETVTESQPPSAWPSQSDVAESLGVTRARVGQIVAADRHRWSKDAEITAFRHELCEQIQRLGGVVTIPELIDLTILLRPAANTLAPSGLVANAALPRMASALARAAVETEDLMAQPRFQMRRIAGRIVVACSQELAAYAEKLGQAADRLAEADPLASPMRAFQELYEVPQPPQPPGCQPFSNERLLNLAAAMSGSAAVSTRQEIYPRGMAPERALRLGIGALSGLGVSQDERDKGFSVEQIRERIRSRYPAAELLPDRPALDTLLKDAGLDVWWDAGNGLYRRREAKTLYSSGSSSPSRRSTASSSRHTEVTPELADARACEERLQHAYSDGGFLVLTVWPSQMRRAESELRHRFDLHRVSFDELFFDALLEEARELDIDWTVIERADAADRRSQDWKNLMHLAGRVAPGILSRLLQQPEHLLLVHPGLLARYDQMSILEGLRDGAGHDAVCRGVWVLVASDGQSDLPVLDHAEIPIITPGQRLRLSESWIENRHRGRPEPVATAPSVAPAKGSL